MQLSWGPMEEGCPFGQILKKMVVSKVGELV